MQLNQNQRINLGSIGHIALKLLNKNVKINTWNTQIISTGRWSCTGRWSSLFYKGCYFTPFIFSLIKDIESNNLIRIRILDFCLLQKSLSDFPLQNEK